MRIALRLSSLQAFLTSALIFLICAGFVAEVADKVWGADEFDGLIDFFGLSHEWNLPTWFSSILMFTCALVLASIAGAKHQEGARYTRHWWGLAAAFVYISLDEIAQLHEDLGDAIHLGGVLYFDWVVPASVVVLILGITYLRFLWHLPVRMRVGFIEAGLLYVGGALLMELPLGWWADRAGRDNFVYGMIDLVEESMEMVGASLFLYLLVEYVAGPTRTLWISFQDDPDSRPEGRAESRGRTGPDTRRGRLSWLGRRASATQAGSPSGRKRTT
jgi:hypothetical protein